MKINNLYVAILLLFVSFIIITMSGCLDFFKSPKEKFIDYIKEHKTTGTFIYSVNLEDQLFKLLLKDTKIYLAAKDDNVKAAVTLSIFGMNMIIAATISRINP
ncbi:MAG: hypothetical protein N3E37_04460 [Candidatus Micrarchaeota archaeon]|nr:hypothetical protein [Candidatus Micrarchaeota archaeon]